MARYTFALLFLFGLVCLASAQTNSTITDPEAVGVDELPAANSTNTASLWDIPCSDLLTKEDLAGVDLANAATACADSTSEGFCSACLCSITTALVAGSPTFRLLASSPIGLRNMDLDVMLEECTGTLVPTLLTALSTETLTALNACDLNVAALTCGDNNTEEVEVVAAQGPATPVAAATPMATPTPVPARSGADGIVAAALFAVPVAVAAALAFITY